VGGSRSLIESRTIWELIFSKTSTYKNLNSHFFFVLNASRITIFRGVPNSKRDVRVIRKNIARLYAKDGRKFTPEKTKKYGDRSRRRAKFTSENMKEPKDDANDSLTSSSSPMSSNST
jgi:hypothetical protein